MIKFIFRKLLILFLGVCVITRMIPGIGLVSTLSSTPREIKCTCSESCCMMGGLCTCPVHGNASKSSPANNSIPCFACGNCGETNDGTLVNMEHLYAFPYHENTFAILLPHHKYVLYQPEIYSQYTLEPSSPPPKI